MRKLSLLVVICCAFWYTKMNAQRPVDANGNEIIRCHAVEAHQARMDRDPNVESVTQFEQWLAPKVREWKENQDGNRGVNAVTTIPVIFHVIHNGQSVGTGMNLSATYLNAQLTQMNNDFRRVSGTSGYNTNPVGADTEVEFCMATVDPNGVALATPGINRINRSSQGWSAPPYGGCVGGNFDDSYIENTIKPQSQWDPTEYLNIWVMDINCSILGYAQFPSSSGLSGLSSNGGAANTDGVVILYSSVGSTVTPNPSGGAYNKGRTLTHEVGHWLGLRHIWGDGGCSVDDYCGDTPASDAANFGCPTTHVSCSSTDMVQNYMDYTDDNCMNIYTQDQKARIQTVLANSPRRNTLGTSPACGGGTPPPACGTTISSFPYAEGFESGFGGWTQVSGDDFDWSRNSGTTPSSSTGPTTAAAGSWYIYTESSSPNYPSKTSTILSPCFDIPSSASAATFSFQYHMYGSAMGSLVLQVSDDQGASWTTVWSQSGNQGNTWNPATVGLSSYTGSTIQLRYVGTTSTSYTSDMSVDDVALTLTTGGGGGSCATTISSFPYSESFESSFGAWSQSSADDFDWSRNSGGTPSSGTGPSSASAGSWYVYTEASSPNYSTKTAILDGPCFDLSSVSSPTFTFDYHLYGASNMGSLYLEAKTTGSWATVWSLSGNQGNSWGTANVDLSSYSGSTVQLRFRGVTGTTWQGDMAVDAVGLAAGSTGGGCNTVNITLTFDNYPEETSWAILQGGSTIASGGTYGSQADGSTLNLSECIDDGCYEFVIYDSYGDGICCSYGNGSYLVQNGVGQTLASGASFGSSETTSFCVSGGVRTSTAPGTSAAAPAVPLDKEFSVYPNPTNGVLNLSYRAQEDAQVELSVVDALGRVVFNENRMMQGGHNDLALRLKHLPAGSYMLRITNGIQREAKRFVIAK